VPAALLMQMMHNDGRAGEHFRMTYLSNLFQTIMATTTQQLRIRLTDESGFLQKILQKEG